MNVIGLREETLSLDDMLGALDPTLMLLAMLDLEHMVGLAALDLNLRAALIEVQTVGKVLPDQPDERVPTLTDASMAEPLLGAILHHMAETTLRTPLEGWGQGISIAGQVPSIRSAGLILPDRAYRVIRMSLDLNAGDRQGELVFALPDSRVAEPLPETKKPDGDWAERFRATVNASAVRLDAQLHRFKLPLYVVDQLKVGQVLPLEGCKVTSLKLMAKDGRAVATARLGQSGGMRAIRVEAAATPMMEAFPHLGGDATVGLPGLDDHAGFGVDDMGAMKLDDTASFDGMAESEADMDGVMPAMEMAGLSDETAALETAEAEMSDLSWDSDETDKPDGAPKIAELDWSEEGL